MHRVFVWQWCDHWFAQKRPAATRHRIANNMSLMLASKHAHAIGAISDSIHMLIALHRARAMGICQWSISRTRLPLCGRAVCSAAQWKPSSSAPSQLSFAITLGTHAGGGQTVGKRHLLSTNGGQKPPLASLRAVVCLCNRFSGPCSNPAPANKDSK